MVLVRGPSNKVRHSITAVNSIFVGLDKNGLNRYLSNFHFETTTTNNKITNKHKKG